MNYLRHGNALLCLFLLLATLHLFHVHLQESTAEPLLQKRCQPQLESGPSICDLEEAIIAIHHTDDYGPLIEKSGKAHFVLIGDSTHGTHEFYLERMNISKRLIEEKKFRLISIEGSWPSVYLLNQYIHSRIPQNAIQVLEVFNEYPEWVWNNKEMRDFIRWLKEYNSRAEHSNQRVSLYGMDIYDSFRSQGRVLEYFKKAAPEAVLPAKQRYACFAQFNNDMDQYGQAVKNDPSRSCESKVTQEYRAFIDCQIRCPDSNTSVNREEFFQAKQNALNVKNTERYYRDLYQSDSDVLSWNGRDRHMQESIDVMQQHLKHPKTIIWGHSSHLGNALATDMAKQGKLNLGQLIRQQYPNNVFSIGMMTYAGDVVASDRWDSPAKIMPLRPVLPQSNSALFHQLGVSRFFLFLQQPFEIRQWLNSSRLQRHVGVIYLSANELEAHYSQTHLVDQFDALVFIDITTMLGLLSVD